MFEIVRSLEIITKRENDGEILISKRQRSRPYECVILSAA